MTEPNTLLILPRLRIQNANAISGNLTWGFPSMTAFAGMSQALERKCSAAGLKVAFPAIGVVCHHHEAQVTQGGYQRTFHLSRNPVDKTGKTAAIVEEGRIHLELSLILEVDLQDERLNGKEEQAAFSRQVADLVATLRVAGGTVQPAIPGQRVHQPWLINVDEAEDVRQKQLRRLTRQLLPGFVLVLRDDLLQQHLELRQQQDPNADLLDAWLDLSRLNHECRQVDDSVEWIIRRDHPGWLVPIPIGFAALSELYDAGKVEAARDQTTPFRFVEGLYSIGQWLSPHQFKRFNDFLWYVDNCLDTGIYRLNNDYSLSLQDKEF